MESVYGIVYCVTNLVNGKMYVGQTTRSIKERWKQHLRKTSSACTALSNAIALYGGANFEVKELCKSSSKEELDMLEVQYIAQLSTLSPSGYNLRAGGGTYGLFTEEAKQRLRAAKNTELAKKTASTASKLRWEDSTYRVERIKSVSAMWGDPEKKAAIIAAIRKSAQDPDKRAKLSESAKRRMLDGGFVETWKAAINTPAVRAKKSAAAALRWSRPQERLRHGELIREKFKSDEYRIKFGQAVSESWGDERKKRQSETSRELLSDPAKPARSDSKSGVRGVRLHKPSGKWQARVGLPNGSQKSLGLFETVEAAHTAYKQEKIRLTTSPNL